MTEVTARQISLMGVMQEHADHLRDLHRKWTENRAGVEAQCNQLMAAVDQYRKDSLTDYDNVLKDIEAQIIYIEGNQSGRSEA